MTDRDWRAIERLLAFLAGFGIVYVCERIGFLLT